MTVTMGILRAQTSHNITSSPREREIKMGIGRSATDPLEEKERHNGNHSGNSSGTSSPRRKTASMDVVRNIRERPSSAIPKYHVVAEQIHRFKMRKCEGMHATAEEKEGIKEMKRWDWKHCGHPGPCPLPVGPMNETWNNKGLDPEQVRSERKPIISLESPYEENETEADGEDQKWNISRMQDQESFELLTSAEPSPLEVDDSKHSHECVHTHEIIRHAIVAGQGKKTRDSGYFPMYMMDEDSDTEDDATTWYETEWSIQPLARGRGLSVRLAS